MSASKGAEYRRAITPIEALLARSPFAVVSIVARLRGHVTEGTLRDALVQVSRRHPNLRSRIVDDAGGNLWLTSDGASELEVTCVPRQSENHWIRVVQDSCRTPFDFPVRPAIRFILLQSPSVSELVIVCHHILCDGLSLAYLARDLLTQMGNPDYHVDVLPDPLPIKLSDMPRGLSLNPLVRLVIGRMNKKWGVDKVLFDQEDYEELTEAYWSRYPHQVYPIELSEAQTSALVERCHRNDVTVNSALAAAFVGAQVLVQGQAPHLATAAIAASLRDRLRRPVGEVMGFYAGLVTLKRRYDTGKGFWENARGFHGDTARMLNDKSLLRDFLTWCYLDPSILQAINFKRLAGLVPQESPRYDKLVSFGTRDDVVAGIVRREKMDSLQRITLGTAITNLARLDFPRQYGPLELDRLIMKPGAGFPLSNVNLVLGAVTCAGKASLVLECVDDNIDMTMMCAIQEKALSFLLQAA